MYKVYKVEPQTHYHGMSLVAAESAVEANSIIADFKRDDTNNWNDSWGYCEVDESDTIKGVFLVKFILPIMITLVRCF